jgi:hypothetical protein
MKLHLHVKYIICAIVAVLALGLVMHEDAKHSKLKHATPIVMPVKHVVAPSVQNKPVVDNTLVIRPVALRPDDIPNTPGIILHNEDRAIDRILSRHKDLVIPKGYTVEQIFMYASKTMVDRSITHPLAKRVVCFSNDRSVLAVCYKQP